MQTIESSKLNRNLTQILEELQTGEPVAITRYGKVVAYLSKEVDRTLRVKLATPLHLDEKEIEEPKSKPQSWSDRQPRQAAADAILNAMNRGKK